jgi:protein-S-isoprenylcysteine O-methyltransferase Ste14
MMYQNELAQVGHKFFQNRRFYMYLASLGAVAVVWATGGALPFQDDSLNQIYLGVALAVIGLGQVIRIFSSAYAAKGTSGNARQDAEAAELNQTGLYSLVRNPLYVGRTLVFTGIALFSGSWTFGIIVFLLSFIIYERVAVYEEEYLRREFPDSHAAWAAEVPALVPRLTGWVAPKYPFWWKRMIWREVVKVFDAVLAIALIDFGRRGFAIEALDHDLLWYYALGVILVLRLLVGALKTFTKYYEGMA